MNSLLVMIGGALGALGRYQFGRMAGQVLGTGWPWGTLGVNIHAHSRARSHTVRRRHARHENQWTTAFDQAFDALEESLNLTAFPNAELTRLMGALGDAEPGVGFRRAMLGERANLIAVFQSSDEGLAEAMAMSGGGTTAPGLLRSYRSDGHLEGDFAFALDFMSNLVAVVALPFPEALDAAAGLRVPDAQAALQGNLIFSAMLLPQPATFVPKGAASIARTIVPDAFRLALGLVPDLELDLHELAPAEALEQLYGRNLQLALLSSVDRKSTRLNSSHQI